MIVWIKCKSDRISQEEVFKIEKARNVWIKGKLDRIRQGEVFKIEKGKGCVN